MALLSSTLKRVVIVDDSSTMRAMLHEVLVKSPVFRVVGLAKSGKEALALVSSAVPDLILIDLCMPYIDGSHLLGLLRDYPSVTKVVLSTAANASEAMQSKLLELGAAAFFDKKAVASDPEAFRETLLKVCRTWRSQARQAAAPAPAPVGQSSVIFAADRFPLPHDEATRLRLLDGLQVANLSIDPCLDIVVRHVAKTVKYPIVAVNLVDAKVVWAKAVAGLPRQAIPRHETICAHTICQDGPLNVADTTTHPIFGQLAMVTGDPHVRSYIGVPIFSKSNVKLGILCAVDFTQRFASNAEIDAMTDAARLVADFLEEPVQDNRRVA